MLTFQQFLAEKMLDAYKTFTKYVEIFIDPTLDELKEIGTMHEHPPEHPNGPTVWGRRALYVRAFLTLDNLFIWNYDAASHEAMLQHFKHSDVIKDMMDISEMEYWPLYLYYYPASGTGVFQVSGYSSVDVVPSPREIRATLTKTPSAKLFRYVTVLEGTADDIPGGMS